LSESRSSELHHAENAWRDNLDPAFWKQVAKCQLPVDKMAAIKACIEQMAEVAYAASLRNAKKRRAMNRCQNHLRGGHLASAARAAVHLGVDPKDLDHIVLLIK
jgi:hypothetical protein